MKINWGSGVVIAFVCFMVFILSFVYRSLVMEEYQHELVSEDYYKEELHYQEEIDKMNKAKTLEENVKLSNTPEGIRITFPQNMDTDSISGSVSFQRYSNKKLDFVVPVQLEDHAQLIPDGKLASGKYIIKIDWKEGSEAYLFKDTWFYP